MVRARRVDNSTSGARWQRRTAPRAAHPRAARAGGFVPGARGTHDHRGLTARRWRQPRRGRQHGRAPTAPARSNEAASDDAAGTHPQRDLTSSASARARQGAPRQRSATVPSVRRLALERELRWFETWPVVDAVMPEHQGCLRRGRRKPERVGGGRRWPGSLRPGGGGHRGRAAPRARCARAARELAVRSELGAGAGAARAVRAEPPAGAAPPLAALPVPGAVP